MRAVGQHLHLPRREVLHRDVEAAAVALDEREALAVRAVARRDVVGALEGQALRLAAGRRHAVDLRAAAAVGGEQHRTARPARSSARCRSPELDVSRVGRRRRRR